MPQRRRTSPPFLHRQLFVALMLVLGACRQGTARPEVPTVDVPASDVPGAGVTSPTQATAGPAVLGALPGRLVTIAAMATGDRNQAVAIDPASGASEDLWTTPEGGNASDWSPAPGGAEVAYRIIQRSSPLEAVEAIVVRGLNAESEPLILAGVDTATARLAGFVWAPEGRRIAYLKRTGTAVDGLAPDAQAPDAPAAASAWELHVVEWAGPPSEGRSTGPAALPATPGDREKVPLDRVIWSAAIDPSDPVALVLAAWDPAAGRAALAEVAGDSGIVRALRLIDLAGGGAAGRIEVSLPPSNLSASPDGRLLALPESEASPPGVRLLELASGKLTELATFMGGTVPGEAVWAPDATWLAWPEYPPSGAASTVRVLPLAGNHRDFLIALGEAGAQPLAFAPDGSALLVGATPATGGLPERLAVAPVPGGAASELPWLPPADAWGIGWVPALTPRPPLPNNTGEGENR